MNKELTMIVAVVAAIYLINKMNEVKYVKSTVDKKRYVVLNKKDAKKAADLLAEISKRLIKIQTYLEQNHNDQENINTIKDRFNPSNISEGSPDSQYTSYTVNKGEKMIFCIRDKETKELHDINLMMYVALHEFAHVMSVSVGHNEEFHKNFNYILKVAEEQGLYQKLPFGKKQIKYCGLTL